MDKLREQLMQQYVDQMSGAMQNMTPEDMARMKDMMAELNQMLEQRQRGEEPDFEQFMERYGDFFPENPQTLDELLEQMARRMAADAGDAELDDARAAGAAPAAVRPAAGGHGPALADATSCRRNLQQMFPQLNWNRSYDFEGQDPLGFQQAMQAMQELGDLDQLENLLRGATEPRGAGRGRHRPGARAARRRRRQVTRAAGRAGRRCSRRPA